MSLLFVILLSRYRFNDSSSSSTSNISTFLQINIHRSFFPTKLWAWPPRRINIGDAAVKITCRTSAPFSAKKAACFFKCCLCLEDLDLGSKESILECEADAGEIFIE